MSNLPHLILDQAHEGVALIDGPSGQKLTYATLRERAERVAATLAARGFGPGDVLAIHAPNIPPWVGATLGAMAAGGAVTAIHPAASADELAKQLAASGAKLAVAMRDTGTVPTIVIGPDLLSGAGPPPRPALDDDALAFLPYSSGTTGLPKGVMLTHANLATAIRQYTTAIGFRPGDVVLAPVPFCHVMGFVVTLMAPLAVGATVVTMPRFDFAEALALIERERVSVIIVPPPVMAALAHHPAVEDHDLSSLQLIGSGGAPLGAALQEAVAARFPDVVVGQGYGMTETSAAICGPTRTTGTVAGTCGRPLADTEVRVVDGELWVRGPQVMAGYLDAPDATAAMITPDGWLKTGDVGRIDDDGNVTVVDRVKELIKVNAYAVAPAELEALLVTHPHVADAAVIPRPDADRGEVPVAVVVPCGELDTDALMAWVAERVAPYKRLADVQVADAIPRTPAGKILRRTLREAQRTSA